MEDRYEKAIFAGGCFWCMVSHLINSQDYQSNFRLYGGTVENPTYQQVCSGTTGHYEAVEITMNQPFSI